MFGIDNLKTKSVYNIYIYSYSSNTRVQFPAFLTDYSDSFKASWSSTSIYGKMDPIATYKNTTRSITLAFDVPSESQKESLNNLQKMDAIIKGMYPIYATDNGKSPAQGAGTYTISSPPMFRIKFANLITNAANKKQELDAQLSNGLLGYIPDFNFKPDVPTGFFINDKMLYPKLLKCSFTLNVIHEHPLGNIKNQKGIIVPRLQDSDNRYTDRFPHAYSEATYDDNKDKYLGNTGQNATDARINELAISNILE
jgi:hypothetical protein